MKPSPPPCSVLRRAQWEGVSGSGLLAPHSPQHQLSPPRGSPATSPSPSPLHCSRGFWGPFFPSLHSLFGPGVNTFSSLPCVLMPSGGWHGRPAVGLPPPETSKHPPPAATPHLSGHHPQNGFSEGTFGRLRGRQAAPGRKSLPVCLQSELSFLTALAKGWRFQGWSLLVFHRVKMLILFCRPKQTNKTPPNKNLPWEQAGELAWVVKLRKSPPATCLARLRVF